MRKTGIFVVGILALFAINIVPAESVRAPKMPGDMRFSEYSGYDAMEWETSSAALADTTYDIPVYRGWPIKPYVVIGDIRHRDPHRRWEEGQLRDAVRGARKVGGDAIIIRLMSESGVGALTGMAGKGAASGLSVGQAETTALVIPWQTPKEISARADRNLQLFKRFAAAKPNLEINDETTTLVVKFLLQSGISQTASDFYSRYEQTMARVSPGEPSDLSGEWVFKALVKESGFVSGREDQFLGIASVRVEGDNVAIVSTEGKVEMNFSGQNLKGRIAGQVGIAGFSARSEGVAMEEKMSLTFQSLTPNGIAQGTIILQRNRLKQSKQKPNAQKL